MINNLFRAVDSNHMKAYLSRIADCSKLSSSLNVVFNVSWTVRHTGFLRLMLTPYNLTSLLRFDGGY